MAQHCFHYGIFTNKTAIGFSRCGGWPISRHRERGVPLSREIVLNYPTYARSRFIAHVGVYTAGNIFTGKIAFEKIFPKND
jgi:hypothetical protein